MTTFIERVHQRIGEHDQAPLSVAPAAELTDPAVAMEALEARFAAAKLAVIREIDPPSWPRPSSTSSTPTSPTASSPNNSPTKRRTPHAPTNSHSAPSPPAAETAPTLVITIKNRHWLTDTGYGRFLTSQHPVSMQTPHRLACDAIITIIEQDTDRSDPHAVTQQRKITRQLRRTVETRDHGCAFPGCDRPPSWTDAHHIVVRCRGNTADPPA